MNYKRSPEKIKTVMKLLAQDKYCKGDAQTIVNISQIPKSTIYRWKTKLNNDNKFDPFQKKTNTSKRIFTDEEEAHIVEYINEDVLKYGIFFTNNDFKELIMFFTLINVFFEFFFFFVN